MSSSDKSCQIILQLSSNYYCIYEFLRINHNKDLTYISSVFVIIEPITRPSCQIWLYIHYQVIASIYTNDKFSVAMLRAFYLQFKCTQEIFCIFLPFMLKGFRDSKILKFWLYNSLDEHPIFDAFQLYIRYRCGTPSISQIFFIVQLLQDVLSIDIFNKDFLLPAFTVI